MKTILISGGNGFIAKSFIKKFGNNYNFIKLSHVSHPGCYTYEQIKDNKQLLEQVDVVINLAGSNIAEKRWTSLRKKNLISSRVESTKQLVTLFNSSIKKPYFISASAVSVYDENLINNENTAIIYQSYNNFSQEITKKWESQAMVYQGPLTRVRFGTVLSRFGGAFPKMLKPYLFYVGANLGSGEQHFPWIALEDLLESINFIIENKSLGIFNLTAPQVINFKNFNLELAKIWQKPCWLNIPRSVIKLIFGQMGEELFLSNLIVHSESLSQIGYQFKYKDLTTCFKALKAKKF